MDDCFMLVSLLFESCHSADIFIYNDLRAVVIYESTCLAIIS
jgi:hypothetical protein